MTEARKEETRELECFLEVQGACGSHIEEISAALAEELEAWAASPQPLDDEEREIAREVGRQVRLLGFLVAVGGDDPRAMVDQLEGLVAKGVEIMTPPAVSGPRRKFTPPVALAIADLYDIDEDESERTVVKKAMWDRALGTNRLLRKDGSDPPPSSKR